MIDRTNRVLHLAIAAAAALAAWLRIHGVTAQVVQDDEWHAIHKLIAAGYGDIALSFGLADHSIPLTLFYKAMADTIGLAEGRMRALQVVCGIGVVPVAAWLAWRAARDAPAAALYAFLLAGAPFLVLYSRVARPYAITTLLLTLVLAGIWRWRGGRSWKLALGVALGAGLAAWLHPIAGLFPAVGCLFVFAEDLAGRGAGGRNAGQSFAFGALVAAAMLAPLLAPLASDVASLSAKAGGDHAGIGTIARMLAIFGGGLPDSVIVLGVLAALMGAGVLLRRDPRLGGFLVALALLPVLAIVVIGAQWSHQGHTLGRYLFPVQLIVLFWASLGVTTAARVILRRRAEAAAWSVALVLVLAYVRSTPTIEQVTTLGAWYGHAIHHFDYNPRYNEALRQYAGYEPPAFYRELDRMPPASAPIIEAPFTDAAPANALAYFDTFHHQPAKVGLLHDLCLGGERHGEPPPRDRRFRFRDFVFLDDVAAVHATHARYLLLHREQFRGRPFHEADRCIAALTRLYGAPSRIDPRLAVWDLGASGAPPKLQ